MLETPFSQTLTDLMELHLTQQRSIPVFLAALITEQFSKQTFDSEEVVVGGGGEEEEDEVEEEDGGGGGDPICID